MINNNIHPARVAAGAALFLGFVSLAGLLDTRVLTAQTSKPSGVKAGGPGGEKSSRPQEFDYSAYETVLRKYVHDGLVDYAAWKKAGTGDLDAAIEGMAAHPYSKVFSREARLAYLVNIYNAYTLQSILKAYPVTSVMDIEGFFDKTKHPLFDGEFTLDEIEKTLIKGTFSDVPMYHFAVVCGGRGCPPLRAEPYTGEKLPAQFGDQARAFITNPEKSRFDPETSTLHLSEIFKWYRDDFETGEESVYRIVASNYTLAHAMKIMKDQPKIEYITFDWKLNETGAK